MIKKSIKQQLILISQKYSQEITWINMILTINPSNKEKQVCVCQIMMFLNFNFNLAPKNFHSRSTKIFQLSLLFTIEQSIRKDNQLLIILSFLVVFLSNMDFIYSCVVSNCKILLALILLMLLNTNQLIKQFKQNAQLQNKIEIIMNLQRLPLQIFGVELVNQCRIVRLFFNQSGILWQNILIGTGYQLQNIFQKFNVINFRHQINQFNIFILFKQQFMRDSEFLKFYHNQQKSIVIKTLILSIWIVIFLLFQTQYNLKLHFSRLCKLQQTLLQFSRFLSLIRFNSLISTSTSCLENEWILLIQQCRIWVKILQTYLYDICQKINPIIKQIMIDIDISQVSPHLLIIYEISTFHLTFDFRFF